MPIPDLRSGWSFMIDWVKVVAVSLQSFSDQAINANPLSGKSCKRGCLTDACFISGWSFTGLVTNYGHILGSHSVVQLLMLAFFSKLSFPMLYISL